MIMKKVFILACILLLSVPSFGQEMATRKLVTALQVDGINAGVVFDATQETSHEVIRLRTGNVTLYPGDYVDGISFMGYNPGDEQTRHFKVTVSADNGQEPVLVFDGDCVVPHGGSADQRLPMLSFAFEKPVKVSIAKFDVIIESSGKAVSTPVYFECSKTQPVATLSVLSEVVWLKGVVRNQDGLPVSGSQVNFHRYNYNMGMNEFEYVSSTDAEGAYSTRIEESNCTYSMKVSADGYPDYIVNVPFSVREDAPLYSGVPSDIVLCNELSFSKGKMATIVLPEAPDPVLGRYYKLSSLGKDGEYSFEREYEPQANTPYVIFPDKDFKLCLSDYDLKNLPVLESASLDETQSLRFYGTYQSQDFYPLNGRCFILDDTPDCVAPETKQEPRVGAFRAYLIAKGEANVDGKPNYVFNDTPVSTGVSAADIRSAAAAPLYDLQGRRMQQPMRHGVYVRGGKKVVR